jgi:hypothetical protein
MPTPQRLLHGFLLLIAASILLTLSPAALAQIPKGDVFFGYSRLGSDAFYPNVGGLNGWEAAAHFKVMPFVGLEGDVAHYGVGADAAIPHTTTFLFGPRVTVGALGFKIFAHGLAGGEHSSNSNDSGIHISGDEFAYAVGVGADIPLLPFFAWRIQGDRISAPSLSPSGGTEARFSTGLVFRF